MENSDENYEHLKKLLEAALEKVTIKSVKEAEENLLKAFELIIKIKSFSEQLEILRKLCTQAITLLKLRHDKLIPIIQTHLAFYLSAFIQYYLYILHHFLPFHDFTAELTHARDRARDLTLTLNVTLISELTRVSDRARDLNLTLISVRTSDLDLTRTSALISARELASDFIRALDSARELYSTLDSNHIKALDIARELASAGAIARDLARASDLDQASDLATDLAGDLALASASVFNVARNRAYDLGITLAKVSIFARASDLDHTSDLTLTVASNHVRLSARDLVINLAHNHSVLLSIPDQAISKMLFASPDFDQPSLTTSSQITPTDNVAFSCFYPYQTEPQVKAGVFVYAHLQGNFEQILNDVQKFSLELGGEIAAPQTTKTTVDLKPGTKVTIVPECEDIEFNPPSLTKLWLRDWVRYEFDFRANQALAGSTVIVHISVQIEGIEIARIKNCAIRITEPKQSDRAEIEKADIGQQSTSQPLHNTAQLYHKIFISYSRKDTEIARIYSLNQIARGDDVFLDTESIRAGENWRDALTKTIKEVDIFQLFWSEHSATSENVKEEWQQALFHRCPKNDCRGFIRPVYWKEPMPTPPPELAHLNFRYVRLAEEVEILEKLAEKIWRYLDQHADQLQREVRLSIAELKQGQYLLYKQIEYSRQEELSHIAELLSTHDEKFIAELHQTINTVRKALLIAQGSFNHLDAEVKKTIGDLLVAVDSKLSVQQKMELTLPIIPFFLDYKIEMEAGSEVDLNAVRAELKSRWGKLLGRAQPNPIP